MAIQSEIVREVRKVYEWWWDGLPTDWAYFIGKAQAAVNGHVATLAVPTMNLREIRPLKMINLHESRPVATFPKGNPLLMKPLMLAPELDEGFGKYASHLAQKLVEQGHIVFFVTRTTAINAHWSKRPEDKQTIQDIFAFAPVVVFYDDLDAKRVEAIDTMILTAQCGIRVIVARPKGGNGGR